MKAICRSLIALGFILGVASGPLQAKDSDDTSGKPQPFNGTETDGKPPSGRVYSRSLNISGKLAMLAATRLAQSSVSRAVPAAATH